ncbi:MAG: DUF542 domain-containing protein [Planctomycetes bacterium]|nr:DUF542 domain-containing protein [Planctomycetota bacterium]
MDIQFKPEQMLPDLLREHPQLRPVFDKYGLKGCGGIEGPSESLEFFAKTHGVEPEQLYKELAVALADKPPELVKEHWADSIYRPFFGAGILIALLAGAAFGTYMMFQMGAAKSVFAPGIHAMNAHAHVMVYGFIGMFVFGFGYQALPRFKHTNLRHPNLAALSGVLLLAGLAMRFFGEFFGQTSNMSLIGTDGPAFFIAMAGTGLELLAFLIFAGVLASTYRASGKKLETYDYYIVASVFWFALSLIYSGVLFWALAGADNAGILIERVAVLQDPLRNMQLYGAIAFLIFGVFFRFLPPVFGFRNPGDKLYRWMLVVINVGLVLLVVGSLFQSATKRGWVDSGMSLSAWRGVFSVGALMLAGGLFTMMIGFRPWRKVSVDERSVKFFKAAFFWMSITLIMLLMLPVYFAVVDRGFLHGYLWGMRHAMTLGFIVMSIVAVSIKIVPTLNGIDTGKLSKLTGIFVALNVATFARLGVELATDFSPAATTLMAPVGAMVFVVLVAWALHLFQNMRPSEKADAEDGITALSKVGGVIETWPATLDVFIKHGFTLLANPVARRTLARGVSLQQACKMLNKDLTALIDDLKSVTDGPASEVEPEVTGTIDPDLSVAEAARTWPATAAVFSELQMDACCGGAESIAVAAEHNGHKLPEVLAKLEKAIAS